MELTEYQKLQVLSLIILAQNQTNENGFGVNYVTSEQMKDLIWAFEKYENVETLNSINNLTEIASKIHKDLMKG